MQKKEESKFVRSDILEGMSSISALIRGIESGRNDRRIVHVFFDETRSKAKKRELGFLTAKSKTLDFDIIFTSSADIQSKTTGNTHGGIIAECTERTLPALAVEHIKEGGVYFILEGVEDPYNFGYALRSLYAAGVDGLILGERNWMGSGGIVARSSAGASELMDMYVSDAASAIELFKSRGYSVICGGIRDSVSLFDVELKKPLLVILGGEKRGISRNILDMSDRIVRIDYGNDFSGSLSMAASASVFAFEIMRYNRST